MLAPTLEKIDESVMRLHVHAKVQRGPLRRIDAEDHKRRELLT
jgi:hypothetical protein